MNRGHHTGCKHILTHLRASKRTSWQYLLASPTNISYDAKLVVAPSGLDALAKAPIGVIDS